MTVSAHIDVDMEPSSAFDAFVDELAIALRRFGVRFDLSENGRLVEDGVEIGRVASWEPGKRVMLEWHGADWKKDETTKLELRFEPIKGGTRVTLEHPQWNLWLGDSSSELLGWFAGELVAPLFHSMGPTRFGDWLTDRRARRPTGAQARTTYRDPVYHRPNFRAILKALSLRPDDYLLEVGCGGGAFLEDALRNGCRAAAVDHSPEMVSLAIEVNRDAVSQHRLVVQEADAGRLPFPDSKFTCAVSTGVFGFLPDPVGALSEIRRTLIPGGRLVLFTSSKELKGTPAAPEPMASRLHFYEDEELVGLARKAGFSEARVERPDLETFARESEVPREALPLFAGRGGQLLLAWKS